jgi:magnesium chelatase family protein
MQNLRSSKSTPPEAAPSTARAGAGGPPHGDAPHGDAEAPRARGGRRRLARLLSGDHFGIDGRPVEVQVDLSRRASPGFHLVGLPGKSTQECRQRIRAAIQNSGYEFPHAERILVNLAPAFQKKDGAVFDLAVALGILWTSGQIAPRAGEGDGPHPLGFLGELGLQGELRPVPGALLIAEALKLRGVGGVVVPEENAAEVGLDPAIAVFPARDLRRAIAVFAGEREPWRGGAPRPADAGGESLDFAEVRGQEATKRGLMVAAAGGHHVLLVGPPGVGKTMLASRLGGILPPLSFEEALEVSRVYSVRGLVGERRFGERPFRAPHHTISYAGLVGGGSPPLPGEISLAHHGVLFLDELPEFQRRVLETLRQPLESGRVTLVRAGGAACFPAAFRLVAAMNPCPCGYAGHPSRSCRCSLSQIAGYRKRISGPLLDRFDMLLELAPPLAAEILARPAPGSGAAARPGAAAGLDTAAMRARILEALERQARRWQGAALNGQVPQGLLVSRGGLEPGAQRALESQAQRLALSARALGRALRLARSIADLEGGASICERHVFEALGLRRFDWGESS